MFEHLLKELERISGTISIPVEMDEDGYFDKECPAEACLFPFKILADDWSNIVRDEEVFCPSCRNVAPAGQWWPREQIERAQQYAVDHVRGQLAGAMHKDAAAFNRKQPRNGFISIRLDVKAPVPALLPVVAAGPMRLRATCEECGCRYSFIGAAFFCPACGHNSATHTFAQTLGTIRAGVKAAALIREALPRDEAEVTIRILREKALQDIVTSFQRLAEQLYERVPSASPSRRNLFQSLDSGSAHWHAATGKGYGEILSPVELRRLQIIFQQRHLLAHKQGIVDNDYVARCGDTAYRLGQRLQIGEQAVFNAVDLIEKLGCGLIASVGS